MIFIIRKKKWKWYAWKLGTFIGYWKTSCLAFKFAKRFDDEIVVKDKNIPAELRGGSVPLELKGSSKETTWNRIKKIHTCCGSKKPDRHKVKCKRNESEGNEKWKALGNEEAG